MEQQKSYNKSYNLSAQETIKQFQSNSKGLSEKEVVSRLQKYGKNEIKEEKKISPFRIFLSQFNSAVVYILIAALIISAVFREVVASIVIAAILVFLRNIRPHTGFGAFESY